MAPSAGTSASGLGVHSASPAVFSHTPPSRRRASSSDEATKYGIRYLFPMILLTQIIVYMEAGAVPALLNELQVAFDMSFWMLGLMGGIGYICLSLGCPVATILFRRWDAPFVLGLAITVNAAATAVFAITPSRPEWVSLLVISRGLIGFTQAAPIIFFPLWCDAHAPADRKTQWMSYVQGGVVIGIFVGYGAATVTFLSDTCGFVECWRVPFLLQVLLTLPLAVLSFAIPAEQCNIRTDEDAAGQEHAVNDATPLLQHRQHKSMSSTTISASSPHDGEHVPDDESDPGTLVGHVGSILGPLAVLPSEMPLHLEGDEPNSNPSPWHTPRYGKGPHGFGGGDYEDDEADEDEEDAEDGEGDQSAHGRHPFNHATCNCTYDSSSYGSTHSTNCRHYRHQSASRAGHVDAADLAASDEESAGAHGGQDVGAGAGKSNSSSSFDAASRSAGGADRRMSHVGGPPLVWHKTTTSEGLALLCSNWVYLCVTLSLSMGYFAIIGISYWSSAYFMIVLQGNASLVRAGFIFCALTAPVGGVLFGGWVMDRAGGYSGLHQRTEALKYCCIFLAIGGVNAAAACIVSGSGDAQDGSQEELQLARVADAASGGGGGGQGHAPFGGLLLSGLLLWMVLFFGSATLPPATGVLLNAVHPDMRPFAQSVATISFNTLGYFGGPLLSGMVMTWTGSFVRGYRVVLYAAGPCVILMALAWMSSREQRKARRRALQRRADHEAQHKSAQPYAGQCV